MPSRRQRKLDAPGAQLQLCYSSRALHKTAVPARPVPLPHVSTLFPALDAASSMGGLPCGRISEIVGPATPGKVTLAAKALAAAQQQPTALAAWLAVNHTPDYCHRGGLDLARLLVVRPPDGADALASALHLVESDTQALPAVEGVGELPPRQQTLLSGALERLAARYGADACRCAALIDPDRPLPERRAAFLSWT